MIQMDINEAHEIAMEAADADLSDGGEMDEYIRHYLRRMERQGFVLTPLEATDEMLDAAPEHPLYDSVTYRAMIAARPKLTS